MTEKNEPPIDWSLTTWKGSRRHQHREFYALPFARKLQVIEDLAEVAQMFRRKVATAGTEKERGACPNAEDPDRNEGNAQRPSNGGASGA